MPSLFRSLSARFRRQPAAARMNQQQQQQAQPRFDPKKQVCCKVLLLDGTDLNIVVSKNAIGEEVYDQVFYSLDLEERDYFGLHFTDHYNVQHWLDPAKKVVKQVPIGPPYTFRFRMKFFTTEPNANLREELTRYQFFLHWTSSLEDWVVRRSSSSNWQSMHCNMLAAGQLVSDWVTGEDIVPCLERGDLVEFRRTARIGGAKRRIYSHWAVYIGKLEDVPRLVHISTEDGDFEGLPGESKIKDSISGIGKLFQTATASVRCDSLFDVVGDDLVRINNGLDSTHRPFPPSIVVERATHQLGAGDYNIINNNCEHFCKWCRYGNKISGQAVAAKSIMLSSLLATGFNPAFAIGAGVLFAITSEEVSRFFHRKFSTNFYFY